MEGKEIKEHLTVHQDMLASLSLMKKATLLYILLNKIYSWHS